ncbi:MAG: purine-nucleoside phosphorylase, partial [Bacteroidota bacterium]
LVEHIHINDIIPYEDIPFFPVSTVESHAGKLIIGRIDTVNVVVMQGRFHYYEGYTLEQITFPVRVMKLLGITQLFISNAAGGLNPAFEVSDLMVIDDHINLLPGNPLIGKNLAAFGPRFPDMSEPYDQQLIEQALAIAEHHEIDVHQGVYVSVAGPSLETQAEYRYLRTIGGDAVGMSTVPEVIVARHMELSCFAISVVTDLCYEGRIKKVDISEMIEAAAEAEPKMTLIIKALLEQS